MTRLSALTYLLLALTPVLTGCTDNASVAKATGPALVVYKTPSCGCCGDWVDHMRQAGFDVSVHEQNDLSDVKARVGLPFGLGSCHTAEIGGYFLEGHVPANDVIRLLAERPDARGLAVPGMPIGSPGMEMPDGRKDAYYVLLVQPDGDTQVYASHGH